MAAFTEGNFVKLFRLAQLMVEYLLFNQDSLAAHKAQLLQASTPPLPTLCHPACLDENCSRSSHESSASTSTSQEKPNASLQLCLVSC